MWLSLSICVAGICAEDFGCIQQTRYWGGDGWAAHMEVVNGYAFFGGVTLRVADLADPTDPTYVHDVRLDNYPSDVDSHGDRVYVVDGTSALTVIDARFPRNASIEATSVPDDPFWKLRRIAVHGDIAVVSGINGGAVPGTHSVVYLLDLSGAAPEPTLLGWTTIDGVVDSLALGNSTAVVVTGGGRIWFLDVSDPTSPFVADDMPASDWLVSGAVGTLAARENLLAMSDTEGRVTLIDVSDPAAPTFRSLVDDLDLGIATMEFEGPSIHVAGSICTQQGVCGGYALVNARAPQDPIIVGQVETPEIIRPVPYSGYVVAAAFEAGMRVVDLQGLTDPILLDAVLPAREVGAIASAQDLMHVVDVTSLLDPEDPDRNALKVLRRSADGGLFEAAAYEPRGAIWALVADGDYVAAAMYDEEREFNSIEVLDVSDPASPVVGSRIGAVLSMEYETLMPNFRMRDDRMVFSLEGSDDVLIYELSEGGRATQVGTYTPSGTLVHFAVPSRDLMVVAVRQGNTGWVEIVDTSDPSEAEMAARYDLPPPADFPLSIESDGSWMAVLTQASDGWEGPYNYATLVDLSDPAEPATVADKLPGNRWLAIGGGILHGVTDVPFPPSIEHTALRVMDPTGSPQGESLGWLDVARNRVDADGGFFCVARDRLEVHRYGQCGPFPATVPWPAYTE
jgi:hypothetical protein